MNRLYRNLAVQSAALIAVLLMAAAPSAAQDQYPSKPIRMITDSAPGGINDIWARRYAQRAAEMLGKPIVVENRPGASGTIAAEALMNSPPDGYTVYYGGFNPLLVYPAAGGQVRFNPEKDFVPVALGNMGFPLLVVSTASESKNLKDLVARAKARPADNALTCGTGGQASVHHFACVAFGKRTGINLRVVPYKSGVAAAMDAATQQVDVATGYSSELEALAAQKRLLALGVFGPKRLPKFPDAPTMAEAGIDDLQILSFSAFWVPRGTPEAIVTRLNDALVRAMTEHPQMQEWIQMAGAVYEPIKPKPLAELVSREQKRWKQLSDEFDLKVEQK